jgi:hypothetical protein
MVYVYRQKPSNSARDLADALGARRYRGLHVPIAQRLRPGDAVVCWGEMLAAVEGVRILNLAPLQSKYTDACKLRTAGVPTIEVSLTRLVAPVPVAVVDPALAMFERAQQLAEEFTNIQQFQRSPVLVTGVNELTQATSRLSVALARTLPVPVQQNLGEWLPRRNNHIGGNDLLQPPTSPDFWVRKEPFVREYRVHSFLGKSIRAGIKSPREGFDAENPRRGFAQAHPWIRSHDGGWRIKYDGVSSTTEHRALAKQAVAALGLDFAAVDIGEKADGSLLVLECNRGPGLEGGTIDAYADAINTWVAAQRNETRRPERPTR